MSLSYYGPTLLLSKSSLNLLTSGTSDPRVNACIECVQIEPLQTNRHGKDGSELIKVI